MFQQTLTLTSVEAQSRFGELIDRSQREPIQVTRRGRPVAYVICDQDMQALTALSARRAAASDCSMRNTVQAWRSNRHLTRKPLPPPWPMLT